MYKVTILKIENNPKYEEEFAKWKEETSRYNRVMMEDYNKPLSEKFTRSLEVILSDEEYQKVKEEVIKVFN